MGIYLPQRGEMANRQAVIHVAPAREECVINSVSVAHHLVPPTVSQTTFLYRAEREPFPPTDGLLKILTLLAVVTGATSRIRFGASVLLVQMRDPIVTARVVATLHLLFEGRVDLALGAGWWREDTRVSSVEETIRKQERVRDDVIASIITGQMARQR
jgi:alkanesulfonate monooxygenase SsuD/methylene tetrahydromethanopterin reductase-like flavin-dependent oxidoreductase (luciferase family)